jgi:hypothetical protein
MSSACRLHIRCYIVRTLQLEGLWNVIRKPPGAETGKGGERSEAQLMFFRGTEPDPIGPHRSTCWNWSPSPSFSYGTHNVRVVYNTNGYLMILSLDQAAVWLFLKPEFEHFSCLPITPHNRHQCFIYLLRRPFLMLSVVQIV